jgi:hypothetical protein
VTTITYIGVVVGAVVFWNAAKGYGVREYVEHMTKGPRHTEICVFFGIVKLVIYQMVWIEIWYDNCCYIVSWFNQPTNLKKNFSLGCDGVVVPFT